MMDLKTDTRERQIIEVFDAAIRRENVSVAVLTNLWPPVLRGMCEFSA